MAARHRRAHTGPLASGHNEKGYTPWRRWSKRTAHPRRLSRVFPEVTLNYVDLPGSYLPSSVPPIMTGIPTPWSRTLDTGHAGEHATGDEDDTQNEEDHREDEANDARDQATLGDSLAAQHAA